MDTKNLLSWILHIKITLSYQEEAIRRRTNLEILLQVPNFQRQRSTHFSLHFLPEIWILQWRKVRRNSTQLYHLFSSQEIKDKRELFFNEINIKHQQLFEGDPSSTYRFTGNHTKIISKEKISTDWLLYYDSYTRRSRDSRFTYGKIVLSTRVWTDTNTDNNNFIINHKRSINPILMTPNQVQV